MKKLALNLEDLDVQSFVATPEAGPRRGTVLANNYTDGGYYGPTCVAASMCSGYEESEAGHCASQPCAATEYPECEQME